MKCLFSLTFLVLLTATSLFGQSGPPPAPAAENIQPSQSSAAKLTNQDVIELLRAGLTSDELLRKIKSSAREFNTSDAAVKALKDAGVPDAVINFIRLGETAEAEKSSVAPTTPALPAEIVIPGGIQLDVEARYTVSSLDVKSGDLISRP
jgi:hypothetical protein